MRLLKNIILLVIVSGLFVGCFSDFDDDGGNANVKDFVWKGMNFVYLYKDLKPDLANDRFSNQQDYNDYLDLFSSPEELFENLLYDNSPEFVDKFSFLVDDYLQLEQFLSGTTVSNGMEFALYEKPDNENEVYGIVRYVLPNTSAESQGVKRGDVFDGLNGNPLTVNNFSDVYNLSSYSINLATYDNNGTPGLTNDDTIIPGTESISLTKSAYTENPILKTEIIDVNGSNIGYLMYNAFTSNFDTELNNVFSSFLSSNITDLVLDLRYNSGGSVNSAIALSSMVTGQFNDDIFATEEWNSEWQAAFEESDPELLINRFTDELRTGAAINSLNLDRVYILTTRTSASASELVINGLDPHIEVVQIGTTTRGKYQASITLYDSPDFNRQGANPYHTYALQPLVYKSANKDGVTDYYNGLSPYLQNRIAEDFGNLGVLGDINEPLLAAALADIEGVSRPIISNIIELKEIGDSKSFSPLKNRMYSEKKLPIRN